MDLWPSKIVARNLGKIWTDKLQPRMREAFWDPKMWGKPGSKRFFETWENFFKLAKIPFFRERLPEFDPKKSNMSWLPINRDIEGTDGLALHEEVLGRLIEKANHRVIVDSCGCRKSMGCKDYPADIGCLMMGESALKIPEKARREVGIEEAKAHVRKAVESGLIPVVGKARIDNDIFMIPDEGKLLTVCLCCECCCVTRYTRHVPQEVLGDMHRPVEGLSIEVTDDCIGCGVCVPKCYLDAIELKGDRAAIGELCRICGRCVEACPEDAIKLKLDNPHVVDDVVRRIEGAVEF